MKYRSAKSILSEKISYRLTDEQINNLHNILFFMLCDLKNCCDRHNLKYMLGGGTCLGAVRHKGFIPWDDDIDVMMPRKDFERLGQYMLEDYGERYSVKDPQDYHILNILLNDTVYDEVWNEDPNRRLNIFIDVYAIDNMPKRKCRLRAFRFFWAKHAGMFILDYKYPSKFIKDIEKQDKTVRSYYRKRRLLGWFFNLFGGFDHYNRVVHKLANYKKETGYLGLPLAIAYNREKFEARVLSESVDAEFCGETFKIPKYYDEYLTNLYGGDYMILPPENKREVHVPAKIDFGKYKNVKDYNDFCERSNY